MMVQNIGPEGVGQFFESKLGLSLMFGLTGPGPALPR